MGGITISDVDMMCGLEIHVQLETESKLFVNVKLIIKKLHNSNICPICLNQPGANLTQQMKKL